MKRNERRERITTAVLAGFAANPAVFAGNAINGWHLVNCTEEELARYAASLADAAIAVLDAPRETFAAPAAVAEIPGHLLERQRLEALLSRLEWNVALVARNLGVTRRTIYMRMERYGIVRQRVPKTLKRSA